jgi:hypothetical protein
MRLMMMINSNNKKNLLLLQVLCGERIVRQRSGSDDEE